MQTSMRNRQFVKIYRLTHHYLNALAVSSPQLLILLLSENSQLLVWYFIFLSWHLVNTLRTSIKAVHAKYYMAGTCTFSSGAYAGRQDGAEAPPPEMLNILGVFSCLV